jgi:hypothetical protein
MPLPHIQNHCLSGCLFLTAVRQSNSGQEKRTAKKKPDHHREETCAYPTSTKSPWRGTSKAHHLAHPFLSESLCRRCRTTSSKQVHLKRGELCNNRTTLRFSKGTNRISRDELGLAEAPCEREISLMWGDGDRRFTTSLNNGSLRRLVGSFGCPYGCTHAYGSTQGRRSTPSLASRDRTQRHWQLP